MSKKFDDLHAKIDAEHKRANDRHAEIIAALTPKDADAKEDVIAAAQPVRKVHAAKKTALVKRGLKK